MFVQRYFRVDRHFIVCAQNVAAVVSSRASCKYPESRNRMSDSCTHTFLFQCLFLHSYSYLGSRYLKYFSRFVFVSRGIVRLRSSPFKVVLIFYRSRFFALSTAQHGQGKTSVAMEKRSTKLTVRKCCRIWQQIRPGEAILIKPTKYSYQFSLIQWTVRSLDLAIMQLMQSM